MRRRLFTAMTVLSLVVCAAVCVLWGARLHRPRIGSGFLAFGSRCTLSLLPDRMAILGPPPVPRDPEVRKRVSAMAAALRESGGTFWYHGTTGGMGFGGFDFGKTLDPYPEVHFRMLDNSTVIVAGELDNAIIPMLLTTLENDQFFLISHVLLTYTEAGSSAANEPWGGMKFRLKEAAEQGHSVDKYDGVDIELIEDRPRKDDGSWGQEIWAVVRTTATPAERARVRDQWHARLDVPIWTMRYWPAALLTLGVSAAGLAVRLVEHCQRIRRGSSGRCPYCGYNLTGNTSGVCPECGMPITMEV